MVRSTIVVRASDALPLAASVDDEQVAFRSKCVPLGLYAYLTVAQQTEQALQEQKQQAKVIFRRLTSNSESRLSIESGPYTHQYVSLLILSGPLTYCPL